MTGGQEFEILVRAFSISVGFKFGYLSFWVFGLLFVIVLIMVASNLTIVARRREKLYRREIRERLMELVMFQARQDMFCVGHPVYDIRENVLYIGSDAILERSGQFVKPRVEKTDLLMDLMRWHGIGKEEAFSLFWTTDKQSGCGYLKRIEGVCERYKTFPSPGYLETNKNGVNVFIIK